MNDEDFLRVLKKVWPDYCEYFETTGCAFMCSCLDYAVKAGKLSRDEADDAYARIKDVIGLNFTLIGWLVETGQLKESAPTDELYKAAHDWWELHIAQLEARCHESQS